MAQRTGPRFADKVCIVTGGASGIGRATCLRLAREGASVAVLDIDAAGGEATIGAIVRAQGQALFVRTDVASSADVDRAVAAVLERWGRIDVLVNDAAAMSFDGVVDLADEVWDRVIAVNLRSVFLLSKRCIPHMKRGAIVNVGSVHAHRTTANVAPYAASKGAVEAFTRALSRECDASCARVNCVVPGGVDTPLLWSNPQVRAMPSDEVLRAQPEEVAAVVAFLASDDASAVHGSTLVVDQGLLAAL